jgi:hypothetical protein
MVGSRSDAAVKPGSAIKFSKSVFNFGVQLIDLKTKDQYKREGCMYPLPDHFLALIKCRH